VTQDQPSSDGFLTVYTRTETYPFGEDVNDTLELGNWNWEIMTYSVHSDYAIYDPSGRLLKSVRNTASFHDPRPKVVALPAGNYSIQGLGDGNERWRVPVVIKAGRVTIVNLESNNRHIHGADDKDVVRGPDGRIIGWLAGPE
jgi:hypothetical protein